MHLHLLMRTQSAVRRFLPLRIMRDGTLESSGFKFVRTYLTRKSHSFPGHLLRPTNSSPPINSAVSGSIKREAGSHQIVPLRTSLNPGGACRAHTRALLSITCHREQKPSCNQPLSPYRRRRSRTATGGLAAAVLLVVPSLNASPGPLAIGWTGSFELRWMARRKMLGDKLPRRPRLHALQWVAAHMIG